MALFFFFFVISYFNQLFFKGAFLGKCSKFGENLSMFLNFWVWQLGDKIEIKRKEFKKKCKNTCTLWGVKQDQLIFSLVFEIKSCVVRFYSVRNHSLTPSRTSGLRAFAFRECFITVKNISSSCLCRVKRHHAFKHFQVWLARTRRCWSHVSMTFLDRGIWGKMRFGLYSH